MAVAKFEAYQHAIETIQTRISDPECSDAGTAKFVLDYISQQNKNLIVALKKIQQAGYDLPETDSKIYISIMNGYVRNIDGCMKDKTAYQMKFLKQLSSFLLICSSLMTIACYATLVLPGTMLASIIQVLMTTLFAGLTYKMSQKTRQYMSDFGYRFPKLDHRIVKNWNDDTRITGDDTNGHRPFNTVEELKSAFSSTRFFKHDKTLDDLIETVYQHNMQR